MEHHHRNKSDGDEFLLRNRVKANAGVAKYTLFVKALDQLNHAIKESNRREDNKPQEEPKVKKVKSEYSLKRREHFKNTINTSSDDQLNHRSSLYDGDPKFKVGDQKAKYVNRSTSVVKNRKKLQTVPVWSTVSKLVNAMVSIYGTEPKRPSSTLTPFI